MCTPFGCRPRIRRGILDFLHLLCLLYLFDVFCSPFLGNFEPSLPSLPSLASPTFSHLFPPHTFSHTFSTFSIFSTFPNFLQLSPSFSKFLGLSRTSSNFLELSLTVAAGPGPDLEFSTSSTFSAFSIFVGETLNLHN